MTSLPGYPCAVCNRAGGAVALNRVNKPLVQFCCEECARIYMTRPTPFTPAERAAALAGGNAGGAYLDKIGKPDLARLTPEEWATFLEAVCAGYCADLRRQADDEVPF